MSSISSNEKKKFQSNIKLVGTLLIFLSPFILLFLMEIFLSLAFKITDSTLFENKTETDERAGIGFFVSKVNRPEFIDELRGDRKKIAIFGGSSANGYASPISLEDYLVSANEDYIIHNYSMVGQPFVGFQEELLKIVLKHYDTIIIYSGHNEMYGYLYAKSQKIKSDIKTPHHDVINSDSVYNSHELRKQTLRSAVDLVEGKKIDLQAVFLKGTNYLLYRSRTVNFFYRISAKFQGLQKDIDFNNTKLTRSSFYLKEPFISEGDKEIILKNYKESINNIVLNLTNNQKLLLLTVPANDLYPPNLDYIKTLDRKVDELESKLELIYSSLAKNDFFLEQDLYDIPEGAHKDYLNAIMCMNFLKNNLDSYFKKSCFENTLRSRQKDTLPYRVLPSINNFIRAFNKLNNVIILDPEMNFFSLTKKKYLNSFVDFHHPSSLGHLLIAEEVLRSIAPDKKISINLLDSCGGYKIIQDGVAENFRISTQEVLYKISTNIGWLKSFLQRSSIEFMHIHYLLKAQANFKECSASS